MNEDYRRKLIKETLEDSFSEERFVKFITEILKKDYDLSKTFSYQGSYIPASFRDYINSYKRICKFQTDKKQIIDVLVVKLKSETTLERARSTQRNFVRWYLNGGRGELLRDAALVAFIADADQWRFSFVKMQYSFDENGKIKDDATPAKRYSFIVGKNENSHTAQLRLLPLMSSNQKPTLEDLEEAFSVERVTNEFFEKYKELFIKTVDKIESLLQENKSVKKEFESKGITSVDFAKKLLGQIVFLYFLQKKGWLGVDKNKHWGEGDKNFIRNLFNKALKENKNFFNEYLEYLFYDALNNERSSQTDPSWHEYLNCRIPFLNGGLFEPFGDYDWKNIDLFIPNELFSANSKDGILDVFDLFNFTVKEDEPLEKEVAIDPELLGKIYEKLNAIRQDNFKDYKEAIKNKGQESKFNKEYGVYYTPQEIVHFMTQSALVEYLHENLKHKTQDLESLKKDLQTLIFYSDQFKENDYAALQAQKNIEEKNQKTSKYSLKMPDFIKNNAQEIDSLLENVKILDPAVGSGAFPINLMLQIVNIRQTLSLYINKPITPYDLKRHCIQNNLYGVDIDKGAIEITRLRFWLSLVVDEEDLTQIKPLPNLDYKLVCGDSLTDIDADYLFTYKNFDTLEQLEDKYHTETNLNQKRQLKEAIDEEIKKLTQGHVKFDYKVYFSKVMRMGGFDIVIGNPPYIQLQKNGGKLADLYKPYNYETFSRMGDIYALFYEKGIKLLKSKGHLCFITSNKWMRAGYGEKLRGFLIKQNPKILIDLGPGVFESATVDTSILIVQKSNNENKLKAVTLQNNTDIDIEKALENNSVNLTKLTKDAWFIGSSAEQKLKEKIERIGKPLKDWDVKIYRGILTGLNEAFIITTEKRDEILANCKTEEERERTSKIIKPILRGRDIKRYYYEWAGLWVIFIPWHFPLHEDFSIQGASIKAEKELQLQYPAIYNHLLQHKAPLSKRNKEETGIRYEWYALQRCAATYYQEFEKEKVVWQELAQGSQFAYDEKGEFFITNTGYILTGKNLKYLLGYLNSKFNEFAYEKWYCTKLGEKATRWLNQHVVNIPIPPINSFNNIVVKNIEILVDKIISAKKQNTQANASEWEKEIDELVYQLYDLTKEEIEIIESGR